MATKEYVIGVVTAAAIGVGSIIAGELGGTTALTIIGGTFLAITLIAILDGAQIVKLPGAAAASFSNLSTIGWIVSLVILAIGIVLAFTVS